MVSSGRGLNGAGRPLDFHDERLREVSGRFLRDGNNEDASEERNQSSVDLSEEYKRRQDSYDMKRELEKLGRAHPPPPQGEEAGVPEDFGSLPPLPGPGRPPGGAGASPAPVQRGPGHGQPHVPPDHRPVAFDLVEEEGLAAARAGAAGPDPGGRLPQRQVRHEVSGLSLRRR
ncbi:hypothetical protein THAOC_11049, partial [Thalassiosira oceanica]